VSRFLVIRLSSIGDIVHALPAVAALGETGAEIHWAVESRFAPLLEGNPYVGRVLNLDTLGFADGTRFAVAAENLVRGLWALRQFNYDAAVDFQGLVKSAVVARLSRSRERVGFSEHWLREPLAALFYTDRVAPRGRRHIVEMNLALAERLGARPGPWKFPLPAGEREKQEVASRLARLGVEDFIILNPGGGWAAKRWPPNEYAELIRRAAAEIPEAILVTGGKADETEIAHILKAAGSERAHYFPSTLLEFIALARRARLVVSGDTGPMHLAAAVGTPIVAIFSGRDPLNTPERNGPFSPDDIVVLPEKFSFSPMPTGGGNYLRGVKVESVLAAMREQLAKRRGTEGQSPALVGKGPRATPNPAEGYE
jgi:lipopolysaccharide heptosyltransferase I